MSAIGARHASVALLIWLVATNAGAESLSGGLSISVRVVRAISVRTTSLLAIRSSSPAPRTAQATWTTRVEQSPSAASPTATGVYVGRPDGPQHRCEENGCEEQVIALSSASTLPDQVLVLTLLPDGAPTAIIEHVPVGDGG